MAEDLKRTCGVVHLFPMGRALEALSSWRDLFRKPFLGQFLQVELPVLLTLAGEGAPSKGMQGPL